MYRPRSLRSHTAPWSEEKCLGRVLCFKHSRKVARDNTVRYQRSTLQLLPGTDRPTYAGVKVDVLEGLDAQLVIEHEGQLIPSQEAPPRPNVLRDVNGHSSHAPPQRKRSGQSLGASSGLTRQGENRGERPRQRCRQGPQEDNPRAQEADFEPDRQVEGGSRS